MRVMLLTPDPALWRRTRMRCTLFTSRRRHTLYRKQSSETCLKISTERFVICNFFAQPYIFEPEYTDEELREMDVMSELRWPRELNALLLHKTRANRKSTSKSRKHLHQFDSKWRKGSQHKKINKKFISSTRMHLIQQELVELSRYVCFLCAQRVFL